MLYASAINVFSLLYDFLNNILFSLAYFIVRKQRIIHITLNCVNWLFMLLVKLPINSRLLVVKFWGSQSYTQIFNCTGCWHPNSCTVQESTLFFFFCFYNCTHFHLLQGVILTPTLSLFQAPQSPCFPPARHHYLSHLPTLSPLKAWSPMLSLFQY